jgi:phosphatidylethanolamine-binding protein (PEBP) family uncharacterized protein
MRAQFQHLGPDVALCSPRFQSPSPRCEGFAANAFASASSWNQAGFDRQTTRGSLNCATFLASSGASHVAEPVIAPNFTVPSGRTGSIEIGVRPQRCASITHTELNVNTQWIGRALHRFRAGSRYSAWNHPALVRVPDVIHLRSEWFNEGGEIPIRAAGKGVGDNISPPFTWDGVPAGTIELALLMEDLDAPLPRPFVHLIAYGIPGHLNGVPEGALGPSGGAFRFGRNTNGSHGYMGPRPIRGHGTHRLRYSNFRVESRSVRWLPAESEELLELCFCYRDRPRPVNRSVYPGVNRDACDSPPSPLNSTRSLPVPS